ncbi:MAG TPA: hypothetical protein VGE06_13575 [Flavisolibacter sp.]
MLELTKHVAENAYTQLIGKKILHVCYTEPEARPLQAHPGYKTDHPDVHMVDRPVRLYVTGQAAFEIFWNTIRVYWDDEFLNYGIKAKWVENQAPAEDHGWHVSGVDFWQDVVGQDITGFSLHSEKIWVESPKTGVPMDFSYPKTIAVSFANGKTVYFSVAEYKPGHRHTVVRGIASLLVTSSAAAVALPA